MVKRHKERKPAKNVQAAWLCFHRFTQVTHKEVLGGKNGDIETIL